MIGYDGLCAARSLTVVPLLLPLLPLPLPLPQLLPLLRLLLLMPLPLLLLLLLPLPLPLLLLLLLLWQRWPTRVRTPCRITGECGRKARSHMYKTNGTGVLEPPIAFPCHTHRGTWTARASCSRRACGRTRAAPPPRSFCRCGRALCALRALRATG